jgi:hypothetical protein
MTSYYEEKYKDLFARSLFKNPLLCFGFSFMLRCIWDEQEKRHLEREDIKLKSLYFGNKRAKVILYLIKKMYEVTDPHTVINRYTNLYVLIEKKGLFGKIVVNHFLKNEV